MERRKIQIRIVILLVLFFLLLILLAFRVGWIQIIKGEEYKIKAQRQQTTDAIIPAERGKIVDRRGVPLAVSSPVYTVWADKMKMGQSEKEIKASVKKIAKILDEDPEEVYEKLESSKKTVRLAKNVDKDKVDKIIKGGFQGVSVEEGVKHFYPENELAACLIGATRDDDRGLIGIELMYDKYLAGVPGRTIKDKDLGGLSLSYGKEKVYKPKDGYTVKLTIDKVIQHHAENVIEKVRKKTRAEKVYCLIMDPKTGEILALAVTPGFNANNPRVPLDPKKAKEILKLSYEEQVEAWNKLWRNPVICDTYEPGSTFKLITTAIALEELKTTPNDTFVCTGYKQVADRKLSCWRKEDPHGKQTLTQAVENSCNPVFIELVERIGTEKYYEYLDKFGLTEKTGIDFPAEGENILQDKEKAGPVGLATMSYGHGISVTPIGLLTAISAIGNDGVLVKPRLVKEILDKDGNVVKSFPKQEVRRVISSETAKEMCLIMEAVVKEGGGSEASIQGFRVGGKTGTAEKLVDGEYSKDTDSSFIGMVPMDDPKLAILLVVDSPQGEKSGGKTAAPGVRDILKSILVRMDIKPENR